VRQLDEAETLAFGRATYEHMALRLLRVRQFDSGTLVLTYRPSLQVS
jgi:hypothetical protein